MPDDKRVAVLGAGMHPWGKWGRPFVEYGLVAARDALADAGLTWMSADTLLIMPAGCCLGEPLS